MTIAGCVWNHEGLSGEGWLAVALVIFCLWRPLNAIWWLGSQTIHPYSDFLLH